MGKSSVRPSKVISEELETLALEAHRVTEITAAAGELALDHRRCATRAQTEWVIAALNERAVADARRLTKRLAAIAGELKGRVNR